MTLLERAYELYKIDWVREHVSKEEELHTMRLYFDYRKECEEIGDDIDSFDEWIWHTGYFGRLYCCLEEFDEYEFSDEEYMKKLLSGDDFEKWKEMVK